MEDPNRLTIENPSRLIRDPERRALTGIPRGTWDTYEKKGEVPKSVPLVGTTRAWRYGEIMDWVNGRKPESKETA